MGDVPLAMSMESQKSIGAAAPSIPVSVIPDTISVDIVGMGVQYPPDTMSAEEFERFAARHYEMIPALQKTLMINRNTGIKSRSVVNRPDSDFLNGPAPKTISDCVAQFQVEGVALGVAAARKAISEWHGSLSSITHLVCVTVCTSSNPGFDYYVAQELGLPQHVQRTLLHGVGCTGGLALMKAATNLALASHVLGQPAVVLCVASEVASMFYRHALEDIAVKKAVSPGVTLFGDGAGAFIVTASTKHDGVHVNGTAATLNGNSIPSQPKPTRSYSIQAYTSLTLPCSAPDLSVDISATGYNANLSKRVPALTAACVPPLLSALQGALGTTLRPEEMDWALHPGGAAIIKGVQDVMSISEDSLRASWEVYREHGNSASATIISVLDRMRRGGDGKKDVLVTAFGPGINAEMMMLQRS